MLSPAAGPRPGRRVAAALLAVAFAAPGLVAAQDPPPPWIHMTLVSVEPGLVDEFLVAQRELAALEKKAGVPWRSMSRTASFGDAYRFLVVTPFDAFSGLDRPARPDAERTGVESRIERAVTGRQSFALRATPEIDHALPADEEPALTLVQIVYVVPGREQDYLRVMVEDVLPHFAEADMHHRSGAVTFGGEAGFVHFFHLPNFAALDQGSPMARALGAEGAQEVMARLAGVTRSSEQWLVRYLPDASFLPEPETEEDTRR